VTWWLLTQTERQAIHVFTERAVAGQKGTITHELVAKLIFKGDQWQRKGFLNRFIDF